MHWNGSWINLGWSDWIPWRLPLGMDCAAAGRIDVVCVKRQSSQWAGTGVWKAAVSEHC